MQIKCDETITNDSSPKASLENKNFYLEDETLCTNSFNFSYLVLNEYGEILEAGRKKNQETDNGQEDIGIMKDHFLSANPRTQIFPNPEDNSTHAYVVINGKNKSLEGEVQPVQVVIMWGFLRAVSSHENTFSFHIKRNPIFKELLKKYNCSTTVACSGECSSTLFIDEVKGAEGQELQGIKFNSKGTSTNQYKYLKPDDIQSQDSSQEELPILTTCFSNIILHPVHDAGLRISTPKTRLEARIHNREEILLCIPEEEIIKGIQREFGIDEEEAQVLKTYSRADLVKFIEGQKKSMSLSSSGRSSLRSSASSLRSSTSSLFQNSILTQRKPLNSSTESQQEKTPLTTQPKPATDLGNKENAEADIYNGNCPRRCTLF